MDIKLLLETLVHLKPTQILYQIASKFSRSSYKLVAAPLVEQAPQIIPPIPKYKCWDGKDFIFLGTKDQFSTWNQTEKGMLWAYNLNYMDWLQQEDISDSDCEQWINKFISDLPNNHIGLDPYPSALRSINWIKVFALRPSLRTKERDDSLYSQVKYLEKKLEYRLLGNHLLEDAYALFIASLYFDDQKLYRKASKLLKEQLYEQVLADGAHYEQSPMYHCILLDRLLDCVNFSLNSSHIDFTVYLKKVAERMLGHLESVKWSDGSIPLLNDSANGIAPTTSQLFYYAKRLGLKWKKIPMKECGYRKVMAGNMEAIVDVGNITATYQPGHTHADTFNYELRIGGKPFVVDTGISTYDKTPRRQFERSTSAHNTVVVDDHDSSRVWGGFRVGKRAKVTYLVDEERCIDAVHDGYGRSCRRKFLIMNDAFVVEDFYDGDAVSLIHMASDANVDRIHVEGANKIEIEESKYSTEYNRFFDGKVMKIYFNGKLSYSIQ